MTHPTHPNYRDRRRGRGCLGTALAVLVLIVGAVVGVSLAERRPADSTGDSEPVGASAPFPSVAGAPAPPVAITSTTSTTEEPPAGPLYLQPTYAVPSDVAAVPGRPEAITHEVIDVTNFFRRELDGRHPRFAPDGEGITVIVVTLPWTKAEIEANEDRRLDQIEQWLRDQHQIPDNAMPVLYVESGPLHNHACGWSQPPVRVDRAQGAYLVMPMDACKIYPSTSSSFPEDGSYLLAHETTHILGAVADGAPHADGSYHTTDDNRDVIYGGDGGRDWTHLMIDPGHDDYYAHGRTDIVDIAENPLLTRS